MTNPMTSIWNTMDWPGTPGRTRLRTAQIDSNQDRSDAGILRAILETPLYRQWAQERMQERMDEGGGNLNRYALEEIVHRGSDPDFIGMAILIPDPDNRPATPWDPETGIRFTRLHRDPDWMGMDELLPLLRGLRLEIHDSDWAPGCPGAAFAVPQDFPMRREPAGEPPAGEAECLAGIARWHGADEWTWHTGKR